MQQQKEAIQEENKQKKRNGESVFEFVEVGITLEQVLVAVVGC